MVDSIGGRSSLAAHALSIERNPQLQARIPEESKDVDKRDLKFAGGLPRSLPVAKDGNTLADGVPLSRGRVIDIEA